MKAAEYGHSEVVKILLQSGADKNKQSHESISQLRVTCSAVFHTMQNTYRSGDVVLQQRAKHCFVLAIHVP